MFNKRIEENRQDIMFNLLNNVFTHNKNITTYTSKEGNHKCYRCVGNGYTVESQPIRQECVVKEGKRKLLELNLGDYSDKYNLYTRGMYIKTIELDSSLLSHLKKVIKYNERFDMKHYFENLDTNETIEICKAYINRKLYIDNGFVKPGEIENSTKPHLK